MIKGIQATVIFKTSSNVEFKETHVFAMFREQSSLDSIRIEFILGFKTSAIPRMRLLPRRLSFRMRLIGKSKRTKSEHLQLLLLASVVAR
jgi:hypothetical protein